MSEPVAELHVGAFSSEARVLLGSMVAKPKPQALSTLHLLRALARQPELWPPAFGSTRAQIASTVIGAEQVTEAMSGDVVFCDVPLSGVLVAVVQAAGRLAQMARLDAITPEVLLWSLSQSQGSDATLCLRSILQAVDPWPHVKERCMERLGVSGNGEAEAVETVLHSTDGRMVALIYLLLRDELSFGRIVKHVQAIEEAGTAKFDFTNPHGEALARSIVGRLR